MNSFVLVNVSPSNRLISGIDSSNCSDCPTKTKWWLLADWITKDFFRSSASFSENKELKGTEVLILNYDPNLIVNNTKVSEKLVDEIEEENDGAFIASEKAQILEDFATKLISNQKDIEPEIAEIINRPGFFKDLLEDEKKIFYAKDAKDEEVRNEDDDIDDFWK